MEQIEAAFTVMRSAVERDCRSLDRLLAMLGVIRTGDFLAAELKRQDLITYLGTIRQQMDKHIEAADAGRRLAVETSAMFGDEPSKD